MITEKVKVFTSADEGEGFASLERDVNGWLAEKSCVTAFSIISRMMTTCAGINALGDPFVNCTITVFYQE
jgi:hypothetical protein